MNKTYIKTLINTFTKIIFSVVVEITISSLFLYLCLFLLNYDINTPKISFGTCFFMCGYIHYLLINRMKNMESDTLTIRNIVNKFYISELIKAQAILDNARKQEQSDKPIDKL